jgi:hypothetical protein
MAVATPAPGQAASTAASAYSNSAAAAPKTPHATRRLAIARAQIHPQKAPGYGSMQGLIGDRRPTQDDLQRTQDDLEKIDKDNQQLDLPSSQDDITGVGQDALTKRIGPDKSFSAFDADWINAPRYACAVADFRRTRSGSAAGPWRRISRRRIRSVISFETIRRRAEERKAAPRRSIASCRRSPNP